MSEFLSARKYMAAVVLAGVGSTALTGCGGESSQTWEIGVVCPKGTKVEVGSLDTDPYAFGSNDARVDVICADKLGIDAGVTGMELTKGQGAIVNSNKDYTSTIEIKYDDPMDGYNPTISMDAITGFIVADNVKVESVAVTD